MWCWSIRNLLVGVDTDCGSRDRPVILWWYRGHNQLLERQSITWTTINYMNHNQLLELEVWAQNILKQKTVRSVQTVWSGSIHNWPLTHIGMDGHHSCILLQFEPKPPVQVIDFGSSNCRLYYRTVRSC